MNHSPIINIGNFFKVLLAGFAEGEVAGSDTRIINEKIYMTKVREDIVDISTFSL